VETFTPADLSLWSRYLPHLFNRPRHGTPNHFAATRIPVSSGNDNGEQFAFLNFYDSNGYFDEIDFTELGGARGGSNPITTQSVTGIL